MSARGYTSSKAGLPAPKKPKEIRRNFTVTRADSDPMSINSRTAVPPWVNRVGPSLEDGLKSKVLGLALFVYCTL